MKTTAFITAFNPGNMGMYTVDRAIVDLFGRRPRNYAIFCAHAPFRRGHYQLKRFNLYRGLRSSWREGVVVKRRYRAPAQLDRFERVVFWGDFTLNPEYAHGDFVEHDVRCRLSTTAAEAAERWRRLFSTAALRAPEVMTLGQNFQHEALLTDPRCFEAATHALRGVTTALPRDSTSTAALRTLCAEGCRIYQGCDAAMLRPVDPPAPERGDYFVSYFARSNVQDAAGAVARVAAATRLTPVGLTTWNRFMGAFEERWTEFRRLIEGSRFMLTDMYHCAVNAIAHGTVPLVVVNPCATQTGTLGDFKKIVLMRDCGVEEFLCETGPEGRLDAEAMEKLIGKAHYLRDHCTTTAVARLEGAHETARRTRARLFEFLDHD